MRVPFADLAADHVHLGDELVAAFRRVLASGIYVLGPEVERFELALAERLGASFAVGVSSGTDALSCALAALDIGPGDEVITTPFSFVSTAETIVRQGATPRFADIQSDTMNLDPGAVQSLITVKTKAIIAVHLFGRSAEVERLQAIASAAGIALIEDAAQALGARYRGRAVGTFGALGCFSFFPTKVLGALGDAGAVVSDDAQLIDRCRRLRQHGLSAPERYSELGGNFRLDALQAALLSAKLPELEATIEARRRGAERYSSLLDKLAGVELPALPSGCDSAWSVYTIRVQDGRRDALGRHLAERGVQTKAYYRVPLHLQPLFSAYRAEVLPNAERASEEVLALPLFPSLSAKQYDYVAGTVAEFFR